MKQSFTLCCILASITFLVCGRSDAQNLLNGPQKIAVDAKRNRLLVSNFNNGALVEIDSSGHQSYFVQGAGFVDGLEVVGDTVYGIGNNRKVIAYNLLTKQRVLNLTIPGNFNNHLSSITYDSAGHLFISCPFQNTIYRLRISDSAFWVFAAGNGLSYPNGILLEKEKSRIVIIDDSPGSSMIQAVSLSDSTVSFIDSVSFNRPDGITRDKYGNHYIGGYYLSGVYKTDADFSYSPELLFTGNSIVYPTYDPRDNSLLVTHYNLNTWERIPLGCTGTGMNLAPAEFHFYPVSPNPFRDELALRFSLEKQSFVKLEAFDPYGRLLATLVNGEKTKGNYSVTWNASDIQGKQIELGVCFFRLSVNSSSQTLKAILSR